MSDYKATLTAENFMFNETKVLGELIFQGKTEAEVRKLNKEENLIKHKKEGSLVRVSSPIFRRLRAMDNSVLDLFLHEDIDTGKVVLIYAIMKSDELFKDFMTDVYYGKIMQDDLKITMPEVDGWYIEKLSESENLQKCSDKTNYKIKQVILRIMQDAGLLIKQKDENNVDIYKIEVPLINQKFIDILEVNGERDYVKVIGGLKR